MTQSISKQLLEQVDTKVDGVRFTPVCMLLAAIILVISFSPKAVQVGVRAVTGSNTSQGQIQGNNFAGVSLKEEQVSNANKIIKTGKEMGMSDNDIVIALMTAMQESTLKNLEHGDDWYFAQWGKKSDSRGLFQQRDSWGSQECRLEPTCSSKLFFEALQQIPNRESQNRTEVAADVQKPAEKYRGHYAKHEKMAEALLEAWKPVDTGFSMNAATVSSQPATNPADSVVCVKFNGNCGSGVIVGNDMVLTNKHMTGSNIVLVNGQDILGTVIKEDSVNDLALIKVEGANFQTSATFASSDASEGDSVTIIGFPQSKMGEKISIQGTIEGVNDICGVGTNINTTNTCYKLSPGTVEKGNSGGGVFSSSGEFVGMPVSLQGATDTGRVIPVSIVKEFLGH